MPYRYGPPKRCYCSSCPAIWLRSDSIVCLQLGWNVLLSKIASSPSADPAPRRQAVKQLKAEFEP